MNIFCQKLIRYFTCFILLFDVLFSYAKNKSLASDIEYGLLLSNGFVNTEMLLKQKKNEYANLKENNLKCYNYLMNTYSNHYLMLDESIRINYFIKGTSMNKFLEDMVSKIMMSNQSNIDNSTDITVLLVRSEESNAYSLGDGIIAVTFGLIATVDNEVELMSILCHELAHGILKHKEKNMVRNAYMHTSKEIGDSIDFLLQAEYNTVTKMEDYLSQIYSDKMKINREDELEADSLGLLMLNACGFGNKFAVSALNKINKHLFYKDTMTLLDYLKSKNIKINENWRYKGDESRMHDIVDNSLFFMDTISTHPEINVRIDQLKRLKEYNSLKTLEKDSIQYAELRINSIIQIILSTYINDNPAETLCYALMLKELDYEQEFSDNMIIISLCKGLFLKQKLQLNYSIGSTDSSYSLLLNQSIHFMQKIRQNEFNDVVCNLMESVKSKSEAEIYSFTAILYSAYFCFSKNKYNYLLHDYKVLNKNGFFKNDLIHLPKKK